MGCRAVCPAREAGLRVQGQSPCLQESGPARRIRGTLVRGLGWSCGLVLAILLTAGSCAGQSVAAARKYLRDEAEVFTPAQKARLAARVERLAQDVRCEIYVFTKVVASFEAFEDGCELAFRNLVKEVNHYRLVLIVLGYESTSRSGPGHGKMYTALGAGLMHVLTRQKLESVLSSGGRKVTTDTVLAGIEELATSLEDFFKRQAAAVPSRIETSGAETSFRLRADLFAGIAGVFLVLLLARRFTRCPVCGQRLRRRVKILPAGGEGGGHAVRRTAKCFNCGYVRKGILF